MKIQPAKYPVKEKEVLIREVCLGDTEQLLIHLKKIFSESSFLVKAPHEFTTSVQEQKIIIERMLLSDNNLFLIAEFEGEIIGHLSLNGNKPERIQHKAEFGMAIQKGFWRLGIGQILIKSMLDWAKEVNLVKITLHVSTENVRAVSLYKKVGFEIEGILKKDKRFPDGSFHDAYAMATFL